MGTGAKNYTPPEWITAEFLQDVLKEYFKDDTLEVHEIVVKGITAGEDVGSGFASEMHRAIFNLKRNDVTGKFSVIIKVIFNFCFKCFIFCLIAFVINQYFCCRYCCCQITCLLF